jgi:hypothetical protein
LLNHYLSLERVARAKAGLMGPAFEEVASRTSTRVAFQVSKAMLTATR